MAPPLSAGTFLDALLDEGVTVVQVGDWRNHNRNHKGPWGPVHGVMIHHTVTRGTEATVRICRDGHSALPGPLCHGVIAKDGTVHLVGYGRANHAGLGDPDVLRAIIDEKALPTDDEATVDGNRHFYGFECENLGDGIDPWPAVQIEAIVRVTAAICRKHGWSARSALRHLDWQPGKPDPRGPGLDWSDIVVRVAKRLTAATPAEPPASGGTYTVKSGDTLASIGRQLGVPWPDIARVNGIKTPYQIMPGQVLTIPAVAAPVPLPPPTKPVVDLSKLVAAARSDPARAGTPVTYSGVRTVEAALVNEGLLNKRYSDGHYGSITVAAYAAWQRRLGYSGTAADGIPGRTSLAKLGAKHGFSVVS